MVAVSYLAKCIRYHRKKSGLTQVMLAKFAGVGKTVVYDIEKGKSTVQFLTLLKVLNVLNIRLQLESPLMKHFDATLNVTEEANDDEKS